MEIIVNGKGNEFFTPNEVVFDINFEVKTYNYKEALEKGTESVKVFINKVLLVNGFSLDDLKTRNFVVRETTRYDELNRIYVPDGYVFNQYAVLKFDYNKNKMANMMDQISKLEDAPKCRVSFGVKDEKECRRKILAKAYKDAELQAEAIALAAGKTLKQCVKVDFKPFTTAYVSTSSFDSETMFSKAERTGSAQNIVNTFTPEDIELTETLYCLWLAE